MACLRPQDTWGWFDTALEHMGEHVSSCANEKQKHYIAAAIAQAVHLVVDLDRNNTLIDLLAVC
jgi:hypothetical protein